MLTRSFRGLKFSALATCIMLAVAGCSDDTEPNLPPPGAGAAAAGPGPEPPLDTKNGTPTIKQIMGRLTKGPNSLTPVIGKALEAETPDWSTIQPQTDEYARLAAALGQNKPRRGSPESWAKLTAAFSESASASTRPSRPKTAMARRTPTASSPARAWSAIASTGWGPAWEKWAGRHRGHLEKTPRSAHGQGRAEAGHTFQADVRLESLIYNDVGHRVRSA